MICPPCQAATTLAEHVDCEDHEPNQADQYDERGRLKVELRKGLLYRSCACQHKVNKRPQESRLAG